MRIRGEITIFLSLLLSVMMVLILTLIESGIYIASKSALEGAADLTIRSLFAEYDRELFNEYGLLYIDPSYRSDAGYHGSYDEDITDEDAICEHSRVYLAENLKTSGTGLSGMISVKPVEIKFDNVQRAIDDDALSVYRQIIENCERAYDAEEIANARIMVNELKDAGNDICCGGDWDSKRLIRKWDEALSIAESCDTGVVNPGKQMRMMLEEVVDTLCASHACNPDKGVESSVSADLKDIMSENYEDSTRNRLLLSMYLSGHLNCAGSSKFDDNRNEEIEYILGGDVSNEENLKRVATQIVSILASRNYEYLECDYERQEELNNYLETLYLYEEDSYARELAAESMRCAWAYYEAIIEMNRLLNGGRVSFDKPSEGWALPAEDIVNYHLYYSDTYSEGYSYEDFLTAALQACTSKQCVLRLMDVINDNRHQSGNDEYDMRECIRGLRLYVYAIDKDREYETFREYSYYEEK